MTTIFHPELSFRARLILYNSNRNRQSRLVPGAWTINLEIGLSWLILLKWRPSWLYGHIWWYLRAIQGIGNLLSMPVGQWCLHRLKFPSYSLPLMVSWAWFSRLVHWQCAIDFLSHNDPHLPQVFYNDMCQTLSLTLLTNNTKKHYKICTWVRITTVPCSFFVFPEPALVHCLCCPLLADAVSWYWWV